MRDTVCQHRTDSACVTGINANTFVDFMEHYGKTFTSSNSVDNLTLHRASKLMRPPFRRIFDQGQRHSNCPVVFWRLDNGRSIAVSQCFPPVYTSAQSYPLWPRYTGPSDYRSNEVTTDPNYSARFDSACVPQSYEGFNWGYYKVTNGARESTIVDVNNVANTAVHENFMSTYDQGDNGEPCATTQRNAQVRIRCASDPQYQGAAACGSAVDPGVIQGNCTVSEMAFGGCICGFQYVPPCQISVTMLMDCGRSQSDVAYSYMNVTDVTVYICITLFVFAVLTSKTKVRGPVKLMKLKTEKSAALGPLLTVLVWLGCYTAPVVGLSQPRSVAEVESFNMEIEDRHALDLGHVRHAATGRHEDVGAT